MSNESDHGVFEVCLWPAADDTRFADTCDVSSWVGCPVTTGAGVVIGRVVSARVVDGSVYGEIEL